MVNAHAVDRPTPSTAAQWAALIVRDGRNGEATAEAVEAFCRERLAGFKIPRTILFEDQPLPRTPTGKVQKFLLVERFSGRA